MKSKEKNTQGGLGSQLSNPNKYVPPNKSPISENNSKENEEAKKKFTDLKKKILKKFPFTISLSMLPAQSFKIFEEDEGLLPEEIKKKPLHLMMIVPEDNFKDIQKQIKPGLIKIVQESKQNLWIHIKTPVDVWTYELDSKS